MIDLRTREGYPAGSSYKRLSNPRIEIKYRDTKSPCVDAAIRHWVTPRGFESDLFKIVKIIDAAAVKDPSAHVFTVECRPYNILN